MKGGIVVSMVMLVTAALLVGCAVSSMKSIPGLPEVKPLGKEAVAKPRVEVLEVKMEKTSMEKDALDNLVITGKAVYYPAKVGAKAFKDYPWDTSFGVYDEAGNKMFSVSAIDFGEYGKEKNVRPGEPFPFKAWTGAALVGWEKFVKAKTVKVERFKALQ